MLSTLLQKCRDKDEAVRFRAIQSILKSDPKMIRNLADQKGEGVVLDLSMFIRGSLTMIARGQAKKDVLKTLLVALIRGNQSIASALRLPLSIFDIFK